MTETLPTIDEVVFGWYWADGASDCEPPEPDREWITITEDGEELATIMHRRTNLPNRDILRAQKEHNADRIVAALRAMEGVQ